MANISRFYLRGVGPLILFSTRNGPGAEWKSVCERRRSAPV